MRTIFFAFVLLFGGASVQAKPVIPPLGRAPGLQRKKEPRPRPRPRARQDRPDRSLFQTPMARRVFRWGQKFQKHLPVGWRMDWDTSQLRAIHWQAGPQLGYQIQFVHVTRKVPVPVPFPDFRRPGKNTEVVPMRCTLHFYPRKGVYRAFTNRISRITPARVVAVLSKMIVFQPDRFLTREFPCPSILKAFYRFTGTSRRGRLAPRRWQRAVRRAGLPKAKVRRHKHHLSLTTPTSQRRLPWRRIMRRTRRTTVLVHFRTSLNHWTVLKNR